MEYALKKQANTEPQPVENPEFSPQQVQNQPWQRMDGESALWYRRFKLYRSLGPKRTLLAALEKEQETIKVLKGTETDEKLTPPAKKRTKADKSRHLVEVPKPKPVQVPGSWKRASIQWHWQERVLAYDEYRIDKAIELNLEQLAIGVTNPFDRLMALKQLFNNLADIFNSNGSEMTFEQYCSGFARMQSTLKDIHEEMGDCDEAIMRVFLRQSCTKYYRDWKPPTTEEDHKKVIDQLGGPDKALDAIRQELLARGLKS